MNKKSLRIVPLNPNHHHQMMLMQTQENVNKKIEQHHGVVARNQSKNPIKMGVTAAILVANSIFYFRPEFLHSVLPIIQDVGFKPCLIIENKDLKRFFMSAFYHRFDLHFCSNMLPFLMGGVRLESSMGSIEFASMVTSLLAMSHGIALGLSKLLAQYFGYLEPYYYDEGVGFSCVLTAMEVVQWSQLADEISKNSYGAFVHGLVVPLLRYIPWFNLFASQMILGRYYNIWFLGHLGGALAGVVYLFLKGANLCQNPLTIFIRGLLDVLTLPKKLMATLFAFRPRRRRPVISRTSRWTFGARTGREPNVWDEPII